MHIIVTKKCSFFLKSFTLVAVLLLSLGFTTHANAGMVYRFLITFTGSGTYEYNSVDSDNKDFFENVTTLFNWDAMYDVLFAEDTAISCIDSDQCDLGSLTMPIIHVTGSVNEYGNDYNGFHNCSDNIISGDFGRVYASIGELAPLIPYSTQNRPYYFAVEPFSDVSYAVSSCTSYGDFWSIARDHLLSATVLLPASALAQGKIVQPVSGGKDHIDCGDGCSSSVAWVGTLTFDKIAQYTQPGNPVAPTSHTFSYQASNSPVLSPDPAEEQPIGIGPAADGGDVLDLNVGFTKYPAPLDLYLAMYLPSIDPNIWMIKPGPTIQPLSQGLAKWKENVTGPIDETIFSGIPVDILPGGQYYFYFVATPSGSTDFSLYYLWETSFAK